MAVTLTYDDTLARVQIAATALAAANYATVERSTDQIVWTVVRGAAALGVTAGALTATLDDYEFTPGVANYYRVRGVETGAITIVAAGAATSGNNASLTPALPAGMLAGDLMIAFASIRNSGTGTVNVPAGWTLMRQAGNVSLLGRRYVAGDVAPTITFAGGVANADTLGRIVAFRRAELTPVTGVDQLNGSAQDIAYPALTVPADGMLLIDGVWKQDDSTAITQRSGFTGIGSVNSSTAGDDASQYWYYQIQTTATNLASGTHTVTGGAGAISRAITVALEHAVYLNTQTASVTPTLTSVWLKSPTRPFLNRAVTIVNPSSITVTRAARAGVFSVRGRTLGVAVNDLRGGRQRTLLARTETLDDAQTLDYLLASGDLIYVQSPPGLRNMLTGYFSCGDHTEEWHPLRPARRTFALPLTEVAAPSPYVAYAQSSWASVLAAYATWADVLAANATWADLIARFGTPTEVIVP